MEILRRADDVVAFEIYLDEHPGQECFWLDTTIKHKRIECLRLLVARHPSIVAKLCHMKSSLVYAAKHSLECLAILLDHGANVNLRDYCGNTPIMFVAEADVPKIEAVRMLIEHGADINAQSNDGSTTLMGTAGCGYDDIVELLLSHGADPNILDKYGHTALDYATRELEDTAANDDEMQNALKRCVVLLSGGGLATKGAKR